MAGGLGPDNTTIEVLTPLLGWKPSPAKLPQPSIEGCAAAINSTHYIILEGHNGGAIPVQTNRTFFYSLLTGTLIPGPARNVARTALSCSAGAFGSITAVVLAGGRTGTFYYNSTEYLDLSVGKWVVGPGKFPAVKVLSH